MQNLFEFHKPFAFARAQSRHRNARPARHDFGDLFRADSRDLAAAEVEAAFYVQLAVVNFVRKPIIAALSGYVFLAFEPFELVAERVLLGSNHAADLGFAHRFVDKVDRLVGQTAVGNVTIGQFGGGNDRVVAEFYLMKRLVIAAKPLDYFDSIVHRGRRDHHRLKTALERLVLFDIFAVFLERSRPHRLKLAAREVRFQKIGGRNLAFFRTRLRERVNFVDKQDNIPSLADNIDRRFELFFERAAIFRTRDERADVERKHRFALESLGNFALHYRLGKPFDDRAFSYPRFADEHGVILGFAAKDLFDTLDLLASADNRIYLAFAGAGGDIHAHIGKLSGQLLRASPVRRSSVRRASNSAALLVENFGIRYDVREFFDHLPDFHAVNFAENARRNARFIEQHSMEKMLRPDRISARIVSYSHSGAEHVFHAVRIVGSGGKRDVRRKHAAFEPRIHAERREQSAGARTAHPNHTVQNMLRTDFGACVLARDRARFAEHFIHIFGYRKFHCLTSLSFVKADGISAARTSARSSLFIGRPFSSIRL